MDTYNIIGYTEVVNNKIEIVDKPYVYIYLELYFIQV